MHSDSSKANTEIIVRGQIQTKTCIHTGNCNNIIDNCKDITDDCKVVTDNCKGIIDDWKGVTDIYKE